MISRSRFALAALCALSLGLLTPPALRAGSCVAPGNLVQNCSLITTGGAESSNVRDWTVTTAVSGSDFGISSFGHNGDNAAVFAAEDNGYDTISQTLSTTTLGEEYTLTFWLSDQGGDGPGSDTDFQALWDGTSLLDQYTTTAGFVEYTFTVDGTGGDTLSFEGYNHPSAYYLSDISLTPGEAAVTPEPSSFLLLGTGLLGIIGLLRRRLARN